MNLTTSSIHESFAAVGLSNDDIVMIHADAGPAAQLTEVPSADRLDSFIESIISYFSQGTVIVPTFSYSLTKKEVFDCENTPSDVGLFTERFRQFDGVKRSCHPIFSVAVHGQNQNVFVNTSVSDCFGDGTLFDELYKHNAKFLCLGCSLDRVTFVHYVEQRLGVSYRFFKTFHGKVVCNGQESTIETRYFVRDIGMESSTDLNLLRDKTASNGSLKQSVLGRFPLLCISATDFFVAASSLVGAAPFALIKQSTAYD